ncbi:hypothetical protein BLNAU_9184 [Blattamonas nauphoetae]|uniref:Uncharacterized protein n=1 Tax=Blattamonas nauphoetae TaxID=2049346 RepID=A0ABQ9XWH7_9EUKA|nr:hypothetical protein BLNAU_9184 [Blattamonas nauphoetae]
MTSHQHSIVSDEYVQQDDDHAVEQDEQSDFSSSTDPDNDLVFYNDDISSDDERERKQPNSERKQEPLEFLDDDFRLPQSLVQFHVGKAPFDSSNLTEGSSITEDNEEDEIPEDPDDENETEELREMLEQFHGLNIYGKAQPQNNAVEPNLSEEVQQERRRVLELFFGKGRYDNLGEGDAEW